MPLVRLSELDSGRLVALHEGDELVVTALVGHPGGSPLVRVTLPDVRPVRDGVVPVDGAGRHGVRGTVPPTAPGGPIRVSGRLRRVALPCSGMARNGVFFGGGRRRSVVLARPAGPAKRCIATGCLRRCPLRNMP